MIGSNGLPGLNDKRRKQLWWQVPFLLFLVAGTVFVARMQRDIPYQTEHGFVFGTVYNANRCQVITPAAISELNGDASRIVKTEYYDMAGRKVLVPEGGIYVKTVRYQNGTTATEKVMVK
jgi:hypothetical protein